ncbi:MAG: tetratricopeptide repeat protein [Symploca sp. SIO1B1]|nr:tetratricopeptide repeat protein [Symploca sp. SIO1B1]
MYNLFRDCIVRLRTPSDRGTGFFVAPGLLLTCYHVIRDTEPGEIEVNWHDVGYRSLKVETREQLDLALLWVEIAEHPCVYLDRDAQPGDELYSYGYPDQDRDGASITVECEGPGDKGQLLTIKDENVRPGFSGAPLLNQRTLKVCGMIQRERQIKVNANPKILRGLGGQAVPTGVILAQWQELEEQNRQFHQHDKRWLEQVPVSCPHNLHRSGVKDFVGRDEVLETLHQQLQEGEQVAISAVAGMGGIGKTELALQYAWRHRQEYRGGIGWFSGDRVATEIINFTQIYLKLNIRDDLDLRGQVNYCWQHWFSSPLIDGSQEKVLVVIDNVTSYQEVKDFLPPANSQFRVLLTTRKLLGKPVQVLELAELDEAAALELLKSLTETARIEAELEDAKELCRRLGYLPLALELVGRYLDQRKSLSLTEMLARLAKKGLTHKSLDEPKDEMTAKLGVKAAFELSWDALDAKPEAQQLGCFLSLFAAASIPWDLVEKGLPEWDTEDLEDARVDLEELHLFQSSQLHPLIREFFSYKREEFGEVEEMKGGFVAAMVEVAKEIPYPITIELVETFQSAIPHLQEVARELLEFLTDEDLIRPYTGLGWFYQGQGFYDVAEHWLQKCKVVAVTRLGKEHPNFANSLNNLANLYRSQGLYHKAEPLYEEAIAINEQSLPENHSQLAINFNNLAGLYKSQGRYTEAEPLYLQAIAIDERSLPKNHPDLATHLNNLAGLYSSQGRYTEAEPLYLQAIAIDKQSLPENHPSLAQDFNNLANLYESQGRYNEAEPLYLQAIAIDKQSLPENHPQLAINFNNLALLYKSQGRYTEAEPLYLQVIAIDKQSLPKNHPDLASHLNNLALLYKSQGRYTEAEPLYLQVITIAKQSLPENHPQLASHLNNLALLYKSQGRYTEAEPLYLQAIAIDKKSLPKNHPDLAIRLNNLALLYKSQGRYTEAEPLYLQAIAIDKKSLPENHPNLAIRLNNLAELYRAQGRYTEAEPLYLQAIATDKQSLPEKHPSLAINFNNLAELYRAQGRYTEAEPLYLQAIVIDEQSLPENHHSLARDFNNLAKLYESQGRYSKAEPFYLEALEICDRSLDSEHPHAVTIRNNFVKFLSKVVSEGQELVLSEHPLVQETLAKIK